MDGVEHLLGFGTASVMTLTTVECLNIKTAVPLFQKCTYIIAQWFWATEDANFIKPQHIQLPLQLHLVFSCYLQFSKAKA
jgi:hypothetical protein